jgi:Gamma tubulin complex component N-terminal/Gamma tubulin complex component C-terminal
MLHEILLSLSGYHSEIWEKVKTGRDQDGGLHKYVSEPEKAILEVLANISRLHIEIKETAATIAASHRSVICRAVGSAISEKHLGDFRRKVVNVEASILKRDAAYVGAYNIVPLSTIVGEFAPWSRRLEWLLNVTRYVEGQGNASKQTFYSGKDVLDYLLGETNTGHSDIEDMALHLLICAQKVWMRSLASWVLYGKLPSFGADDFFVKQNPNPSSSIDRYSLDSSSVPSFVTLLAAESILATGNALNQIQSHGPNVGYSPSKSTSQSVTLLSQHLQLLESLTYPLNPPILQSVLANIDHSISQNALSRLLPVEQIVEVLHVIHRFVLLGSGEFAVSLIEHGAVKAAVRQTQPATKPVRKLGRLDDLTMKDAELCIILTKTWDELAALQIDAGVDDETFVFARRILTLQGFDAAQSGHDRISTWLPTPALLNFNLPSDSTLLLFLSPVAMQTYSSINSYLLSVRRAELQLSSLWKVTSQRRCQPTPLGPPNSSSTMGKQILATRRAREDKRSAVMRQHWASANKALFLVNQFEGYLHGEVINNSWQHFDHWIQEGVNSTRPGSSRSQGSRPGTASSSRGQLKTSQLSNSSEKARDPRTLAQGHQAFLAALHAGLLLDKSQLVIGLRSFLNLIDHYVALFHRLQTIWEGLDLQEDDGVVDAFSNYAQDETSVLAEMSRSRTLLEEALIGLVTKLKDTEKERLLSGMASDIGQLDLQRERFVPWRPRTMDRLIMRLDFLAGAHERETHDDENEGIDGLDY